MNMDILIYSHCLEGHFYSRSKLGAISLQDEGAG